MNTIAAPRVLCGVEVDELGQPLKAWTWPLDIYDDYQVGAHDAYNGLSRRGIAKSAEYNAGRAAQIKLLPKKQGHRSAVEWGRRDKLGGGWRLGGW